MALDTPAPFAMMLGAAAWQRAAFSANLALEGGVVQLAWDLEGEGGTPRPVADTAGAGLAFDTHCRLYHSVAAEQRVERVLWAPDPPAQPQSAEPPADLLVNPAGGPAAQPQVLGALAPPAAGFEPDRACGPAAGDLPPPAFTPRALACDGQDHLYVLDTRAHQVWVLDLQQRRLLRAEPVAADTVDIEWHAGWLWLLAADGALHRMSATRSAQAVAVAAPAGAARLSFAPDGRLFVLLQANTAGADVVELGAPGAWLATPVALSFPGDPPFAWASDLAVVGGACCASCQGELSAGAAVPPMLVVARRCEEAFTRVDLSGSRPYALAEPLSARHYDGLGIVATPDGRVAFWTAKGARTATRARLHYRSPGQVLGFRLDSGPAQDPGGPGRWGRLFLDACLPPGTRLALHCIVSDDDLAAPRAPRTPPANQSLVAIPRPLATPLPLLSALPDDGADASGAQIVFKRSDGSEQPWRVETETFDTFEAVSPAVPGRYLWLLITLSGSSRATPRLRGVRAECPAHDWLRRLPQLYSRQDAMRQFLQRFLAPLAGLDDDLAAQSDTRHALLKPCSTPAAVLPWLAGFIGLSLDERWSERARRSFIREAPWLFRLRGTNWALRRMLEIVSGAPVVIVEQFRLRGLSRLGADPSGQGWDEPAVLGLGWRVGGPIGDPQPATDPQRVADSFAANAHRFTVLVQADLDADTEAALQHLLAVHRPAHTLFTLCALGHGARIGRGLQIGLSTVVGQSGGFAPLQLGAGTLGRGQVLGRPVRGLRPGSARIGAAARIG